MSDFATMSLIVSRCVEASRTRRLPVDGEVKVVVGQELEADTVVAEAMLPGSITPVGAAAALSIPPRELPGMALVQEGERAVEGQPIARVNRLFGLWKVELEAPVSGVVSSISTTTGQILIEGEQTPLVLDAYLPGLVEAVEERRGVTIASSVSLVQGAFGVGPERYGPLVPLETADDIDGAIVWTAGALDATALRDLVRRGAVGAIAGSVAGETVYEFVGAHINPASTGGEKPDLTLVVTEGFGQMPMAVHVRELLRDLSGKRVSINGATQVRAGVLRPEIVGPPLAGPGDLDAAEPRVRIVRGEAFGRLGVIEEEPVEMQRLKSGVEALVYKVRLDGGGSVVVPRVNTERV